MISIWSDQWTKAVAVVFTALSLSALAVFIWRRWPRAKQETLRNSEESFRLLVENTKEYAIYMLDPSGVVSSWNEGGIRLKGYQPKEIIGRHFSIFYTREDHAEGMPAKDLAQALEAGSFKREMWDVRKDGTRFFASVLLSVIKGKQGKVLGFSRVTQDLTERKRMEEQQEHLFKEQAAREESQKVQEELRKANKMKDEFLATLSHELRTPLNAIVGFAELLRYLPQGTPEYEEALEALERNAAAQTHLVTDLLDVSSIVEGAMRLDLRALEISQVIHEAMESVKLAAIAKNIEITLDLSVCSSAVMGDPIRLRQVCWNLLSNALRFTPKGGHITVSLRQVGSCMQLDVIDTGVGIDADFLPYVFDRFRQQDSSYTRSYGGLGLGLAITRHIVEQHGGTIAAASNGHNQGAMFTVQLPVSSVANANSEQIFWQSPSKKEEFATIARYRRSESLSLAGISVLAVDDHLETLTILKTTLELEGAQVFTASSAAEAMLCLELSIPTLIISDIGMPHEDGFTFRNQVKGFERKKGVIIPSIAFTAHVRPEERAEVLAAGYTAHLGKPARSEDLLEAVQKLVTNMRLVERSTPHS